MKTLDLVSPPRWKGVSRVTLPHPAFACAEVRCTAKGYSVRLRGATHPERRMPAKVEVLWFPLKSGEGAALPEHIAKLATHTAAARRIRTYWEGLCLVTDWRNSRLSDATAAEVAAEINSLFGQGWAYINPQAQDYARAILKRELAKFTTPDAR